MTRMETTEDTKDKKKPLPEGWRWVRLGEVASTISKGTTPTTLGLEYTDAGIPFLRAEDVNGWAIEVDKVAFHISNDADETLSRSRLLPGDFLITIAGTLGRVGFVPPEVPHLNCNQAVSFARLDQSMVDAQYLCFVCSIERVIAPLLDQKAGGALQNLNLQQIRYLDIPLPPLSEQRRIAGILRQQMAAVEKARAAAQDRLAAAKALPASFVSESLTTGLKRRYSLDDCLIEIRNGIGTAWSKYPVLGATRDGLAPAKEGVGKAPVRYKLVDPVTVFYNPMRILLGSIAMVDEDDAPGITSPDYVVVKGRPGILDTRWFYYWFRSAYGAHLVESLSRGAVRERILYNRLSDGEIDLPDYNVQKRVSESMRRVRDVIEPLTKELAAITALPAALLHQAFNGEL